MEMSPTAAPITPALTAAPCPCPCLLLTATTGSTTTTGERAPRHLSTSGATG